MIVVIAGMQRSGSTFSFNVVRELLESRGGAAVVSTNSLDDALSVGSDANNLIIKSHAPDQVTNSLIAKGALKCICTLRKPEDAIASWMRVFSFPLDASVTAISDWLAWHKGMRRYVFNIDYDMVDRRPLVAAYRIGRAIVPDLSIAEIIRIWWCYRKSNIKNQTDNLGRDGPGVTDIGFSFYDARTFFHRHHVSSLESITAEQQLPLEDLQFIREKLRDYVDPQGNYKVGGSP